MRIINKTVEKWDVFEVELASERSFARPFEEVELSACFTINNTTRKVNGFYDGNSTWRIRFMPEETGEYAFRIESNNSEFDGLTGSFHSTEPSGSNHGPVKVDKKYHFSYADGTPCFIMGTTAYAWTYRPEEVRKKTLESIGKYNFNKVRMLVFPKYLAGFEEIDLTYEPPVLPYEGERNNFDYKSFNVEYFRNFEERVRDLLKIGVEADVILFHNYDFGMWGIDDGLSDDDALFYLKYLIARISAYRNVWWSLANEYDIYKEPDGSGCRFKGDRRDWDRIGNYIMENDPYSHPRSIHECFEIYPDREWMTHVSCQKSNTYSLLMDLKHRYQKPVIDDEYQYEGNLSNGWGNLYPQEEVLRHWLSVMAGAYATHGECYVVGGNKKDIFWTYGGEMVGKSAFRLKFLREIVEKLPFQDMGPNHARADGRNKFCLSKGNDVHLFLLTENCPDRWLYLSVNDGADMRYDVTVYDLWNCIIVEEAFDLKHFDASRIPGLIVVKAVKKQDTGCFVPIKVDPKGYKRIDKPIEVILDLTDIFYRQEHGGTSFGKGLHLVEADSTGAIINDDIQFQFDRSDEAGEACKVRGTLVFIMKGITYENKFRFYRLYLDGKSMNPRSISSHYKIDIIDNIFYKGQDSYRIITENAVYYYHKEGAGFAAVIDREGYDWISYHPTGGSAGNYRGIPNLIYPEGKFHPGARGCTSRIVVQGPLKVTIYSETTDKEWACTWDIFPAYARLTVLKTGHPYWFLYEGTPGGRFKPDRDYCVTSEGKRRIASEQWDETVPNWIYFGDGDSNSIIYLARHEKQQVTDSYRPMEGNMTVFGYGRLGLDKFMELTPARFTVGFAEDGELDRASEVINSAFEKYDVYIG